jgi:hypothetical protein
MAFLEDAGLLVVEPFENAPTGDVTGDTLRQRVQLCGEVRVH